MEIKTRKEKNMNKTIQQKRGTLSAPASPPIKIEAVVSQPPVA
jgi:hypothetical protein